MNKEPLERSAEDLQCERSWAWEGVTVLRATVTLPQFRGRRARRLNRYYRRCAQAYLTYCETELFPRAAERCRAAMVISAPWFVSSAALRYTVTYESGGILSLRTDASEEGLPPAVHLRRSDTWELHSALPLPLADFFPKKSAWRKTLLSFVRADACARLTAGSADFYPTYRRALRRFFNTRNFYLTDEGICLFYQMYTIAPAREGVVEFFLPYGDEGPLPPHQTKAATIAAAAHLPFSLR